jgi:hypothetical protein
LPDVIIGEYAGNRIVLEGKVERQGVEESLDEACRNRVEEAIAAICIGVIYPMELRDSPWEIIDRALGSSVLKIKVYTATREIDWAESDLNGLAEVLRRGYETLISEDIVENAVTLLSNTIESCVGALAAYRGTEGRLREILVVPKSPDR